MAEIYNTLLLQISENSWPNMFAKNSGHIFTIKLSLGFAFLKRVKEILNFNWKQKCGCNLQLSISIRFLHLTNCKNEFWRWRPPPLFFFFIVAVVVVAAVIWYNLVLLCSRFNPLYTPSVKWNNFKWGNFKWDNFIRSNGNFK